MSEHTAAPPLTSARFRLVGLPLIYAFFLLQVMFCLKVAGQSESTPQGKTVQSKQDQHATNSSVSASKNKPATPASQKIAGTQTTGERLLPPIVHDFTTLLAVPNKPATPAELKDIVAFVTTDTNQAYPATVKTLAPDYAILTNPTPSSENASSVLIGRKTGSKPSLSLQLSSNVTRNVVISGEFSILAKAPAPDCAGTTPCAVLLAADGTTTFGRVTSLGISPSQVSVTYVAPADMSPASVRIQNGALHYPILPLGDTKAGNASQAIEMRQVIAGDFCQPDANEDCTTDLFKPDHPSAAKNDPHSVAHPVTGAYVLQEGSSAFKSAHLNSLGIDTADISFTAPADFKPAYLVIATENQSYRFPYTPAPPLQTSDLNYQSDELSTLCNQVQDPAHPDDTSKTIPDCDHTPPSLFSLKSLSAGSEAGFVALKDDLIVARVNAPAGLEPAVIIVTNVSTKKSTIARRMTNPGESSNALGVSMSIMDQVTAQRNYGSRIAKRYLAVTLDVYNPTSQKVQFNKSAIYFDVDYIESREPGPTWTGFAQSLAEYSTLGLYQPSVYEPPFVPNAREGEKRPRVSRFGLEQNVKQAPENFLSVLGSFDYTTTKTDDKLKVIELIGSILTNIATGGVVADASGSFRAGTSIFSGTFLPGVRSVVLDTSFINRLRSNLVAQTFQETLQVPAKGSATTIVLLPRTGILSFTDATIPVMIQRVLRVHLVEEIVTPVNSSAVKKDECTVGNTKDQIRQALGEPSSVTTAQDGTSTFSFSKGPVATVNFDKAGVTTSCSKPRTATEQMDLVTTLVEAKQTVTDLGLTATEIALTDGSTLLVDIPGVSKTYHFDSKGDVAKAYTLLFPQITAEATKTGETQSNFEAFLESAALSPDRKKEISAKAEQKAKAGEAITYPSPDVQKGTIKATFKSSGTGKSATAVLDNISFEGDQPKNIK